MDYPKSRTILNKIHNKTLIVETIFPFVLNQPFKLYKLIISDSSIQTKLNKLFSEIKKSNNQLDKGFIQNLNTISYIKDIINKLNKIKYDLKSDTLNYKFVKNKLNYSYIKFLYNSLFEDNKKVNFLNNQILKNIIIEYYSTLNYIVISNVDVDFNKYIKLIRFNEEKKNQHMAKLLLIFDEYCYNNSCDVIYHPNIKEIEIIFEDKYINNEDLYSKLNIYLSKIKHIETIQKIIFHNINLNNYIPYYNKIFNNNSVYQSKLCFLIDNYYKVGKKRESQFEKIKNINEVKLEDNDFLYLYEKIKIYYFINELFHRNSQLYIKEKTMIINNKNTNKDFRSFIQLISSIKQNLNDNENITNLFIINDKKILNNEKINEKELELNLNDIKEFCFISEQPENYKNLIDMILGSNANDNNNNYLYEGYDNNNNLIFYRRGLENILSFDLIELFKYNKILTKIKLITEQIIINYNEERTKIEILNICQKKSELSIILGNRIKLTHFTPFIYNQKNLEEIKINNFDYQLKDITNLNLKIISINFEKEVSNMKCKNTKGDTELDLLKTFPMLINLNIGGDYKWLLNLKIKNIPKNINIIAKNQNKKLLKFQKKLKKSGIDINIKYMNTDEENQSEEETEQEEEEEEDEDNFDFQVNNNYSGPKSKNAYKEKAKNKYVEFKKGSIMTESIYLNKIIEQQRAYLVDYSSILKEYLKISKKNDFARKFCYNSEPNSYLELKYRASDHKKLKEKIFEEIYDIIKFPSFVMKTSIDVYIIFFSDFEKNHYPPTIISKLYIFDMEGYTLYSVYKKEFLNIINFCNNFSSGEFKYDIKLKDKIIPKGKTFIIEDIELFALRNKNVEIELKNYIPIK